MNCITTGQREQLFLNAEFFYLRGGGKLEKWRKAEFNVINTSSRNDKFFVNLF